MERKFCLEDLSRKSHWLRKELFRMMWDSGTGSGKRGLIPSCFSCVEIVVALHYGGVLRDEPRRPDHTVFDTLIVSKGQAASVVYPILADKGYFPASEIEQYGSRGGILTPYALHTTPGIESITGSLGHGFGIAAGIAFSAKIDHADSISYVILGDGECHEGSIWENAAFSAHHELDNLVAIVDRNELCTMGKIEEIIRIEPLEERWQSFGWFVRRVNGHSFTEILQAFSEISEQRKQSNGESNRKPAVIIADTVKGKGISFMEGSPEWHNKRPTDEQIQIAISELESCPSME